MGLFRSDFGACRGFYRSLIASQDEVIDSKTRRRAQRHNNLYRGRQHLFHNYLGCDRAVKGLACGKIGVYKFTPTRLRPGQGSDVRPGTGYIRGPLHAVSVAGSNGKADAPSLRHCCQCKGRRARSHRNHRDRQVAKLKVLPVAWGCGGQICPEKCNSVDGCTRKPATKASGGCYISECVVGGAI
jgi:hypothetical protein